ncbi:copper-translocating P-type ATPase [Cellulomonas carbonis]|uniref:ATPase n=1 Tax=Cellulomonas carbonis T26 TaxID=947969 RepID=A0A0A0BNN9_9CELL|nr:copper-translocating P-type ATPase [Cellulomonas carbonis]KGM09581.1 ATPase [Cellulomonas carbonis T26]GGC07287.1 copper-translocating P-type ATPase [Cellulomonas carbonis]
MSHHTEHTGRAAEQRGPRAAEAAPHGGHGDHGDHGGHGGHGAAVQHAGHGNAGHGDHAARFRDRFWLSLVLAVPVVLFSEMFAHLLGYVPPAFPGSTWVSPVLGTVVYLYGGWPFLTGALVEARSRRPGMMLLVSLAITVAFLASWATTLGAATGLDFWWELALLVVIMLLGHWLEMRALGAASGALDALAALLPDLAEVVTDGGTTEVPLDRLRTGDVVLVRAGGRVPADGVVVDGSAHVDEAMITGESKAVRRAVGDTVVGGTVSTDSTLRVRVTAIGADTALAGIQRLVADAQASASRAQALADRAAGFLFWFALAAGVLTFAAWAALGDMPDAVERTVTVLVIACPHALGLAIPLVIAISTERAARAGLLVKDRLALERMRTVDTVLFDKTGTLTVGRPTVTDVAGADGWDDDVVLGLAAAVEADSEHPVARAVVRAGERVAHPVATGLETLAGRGVRAEVEGRTVHVGGPALLAELGVAAPEALDVVTAPWAARGASVLHVVRDGAVVGALAVQDAIRPESREAVAALRRRGVQVAMVTGDARNVAEAVAADLGIDEVFAQVLPADKHAKVAELQARGRRVAAVGDGLNDSPALAAADVGIAIGAGTDVAVESAGVVLASDDPRGVVAAIELSRASYRKMWQNLAWATGYNLVAIPLAAGVLAWAGFVLSPAVGAVLMSASTVVVALNAQLLRRLDLDPARVAAR